MNDKTRTETPEYIQTRNIAWQLNIALWKLPDDERVKIIAAARAGFCIWCGSDSGPSCQCTNDE